MIELQGAADERGLASLGIRAVIMYKLRSRGILYDRDGGLWMVL